MNKKYIRVELLMDFLDRNARDDLLTPADIGTALEMIPAEDVKPVVHAHWEIEKTVYARFARCSACGMPIRIPTTGHKESERFYMYPDEMHYCPHCGARMDEEEGNDTRTER